MISLDTSKWKEFKLVDLFKIYAGKYHYSSEYENGNTPYVSASNMGNAIAERISLEPDFKGNKITTGKVGCTAFYQEEDFCATSDVNIFTPLFEMNRYIGLFIVTIINFNENYKWGYGRQCRVGDSKEIVVRLPATKDGKPDFDFMENYMKSIWGGSHYTLIPYSKNDLNTVEWKDFVLGELFDKIYKGKAYVKGELSITNNHNGIPFISRTDVNNGCDAFIDDEIKNYQYEKGNAIIIGDTTSTCYYQEKDFICGDHIVVLRAKWINKYTALFLKTILEYERYKYSYGRAFKMDLIKSTIIKLPVTPDGEPDYIYMENYIKQLQFSDMI